MWRARLAVFALSLALLVGCGGGAAKLSDESSPPSRVRDAEWTADHRLAERSARSSTVDTSTADSEPAKGQPCPGGGLRLSAGEPVEGGTGEHTVLLMLHNMSGRRCHLYGYPRVTLLDNHGGALPFRYGTDGYMRLTDAPPKVVLLERRGVAYFAVSKYRCDLGSRARALQIRVRLPRGRSLLELDLPRYPSLDYCGRGDPGSAVHISPLATTQADVFDRFSVRRAVEARHVPPPEPPQRWVGVRRSNDRLEAVLFRTERDPRVLASWSTRISEETPGRPSVTDVAVDRKKQQAYVATCCEPVAGSIWRTSLHDGARGSSYADQGYAVDVAGRVYARADKHGSFVIYPRRPSQRGKFVRGSIAATQVSVSPARDQVIALINPRRSSNPVDDGPAGVLTVTRSPDGGWRRAFTELSPQYCAVVYLSPTTVGLLRRKTERPSLSCRGARVDSYALSAGRLTKGALRLPETSRHLSTDPSGAYLIYTTTSGAVRWITRDGRGGLLACGDFVAADW